MIVIRRGKSTCLPDVETQFIASKMNKTIKMNKKKFYILLAIVVIAIIITLLIIHNSTVRSFIIGGLIGIITVKTLNYLKKDKDDKK